MSFIFSLSRGTKCYTKSYPLNFIDRNPYNEFVWRLIGAGLYLAPLVWESLFCDTNRSNFVSERGIQAPVHYVYTQIVLWFNYPSFLSYRGQSARRAPHFTNISLKLEIEHIGQLTQNFACIHYCGYRWIRRVEVIVIMYLFTNSRLYCFVFLAFYTTQKELMRRPSVC